MKKIIENKNFLTKFIYRIIVYFVRYLKCLIVTQRQKIVYKKLRLVVKQNERKLKIAFLVNENEKWSCQNLYDKLKQSKHFEPIIFLTSINDPKIKNMEEKEISNIEFFNKYCDNVQKVYNDKIFDNLKKYSPDIVVYQQPWYIEKNQNIFSISKFALAIYIPYGFVEKYGIVENFKLNFYYMLFREYISHNLIGQEYKNNGYKRNNLRVVGYPKLEEYLDNKKHEKKYVIYAPHYSVKDTSIKLGTFDWNGQYILEYAKKHPEFNWIFKPHPLCKNNFIKTKIFENMEQCNEYYNEWTKIGTIYDKGNYIDLFKQTKCLITDCASFLIEILPTDIPVINLKRKDSEYISDITEKIIKSYYQVYNLENLKKVFCDILEKNMDTKKQERINLIKELNLVQNASDNIIEDLRNTFL